MLQDDTAEVQPGKSASVPLHLATPPSETIPQTGLRMVRINVYGNPAQVYLGTSKEPQGNPHPTPYQTAYPRGTHLYFVLQRPGYRNCVGEFSVQDSTEANNYTYQLCKTTGALPTIRMQVAGSEAETVPAFLATVDRFMFPATDGQRIPYGTGW